MASIERKTHLTQRVYRTNLEWQIVPRWSDYSLRKVSSIDVEDWLKTLPLANSTKAKLRNVMSAVFRHAIRWGWLGQHENPIALVRVSASDRLFGKMPMWANSAPESATTGRPAGRHHENDRLAKAFLHLINPTKPRSWPRFDGELMASACCPLFDSVLKIFPHTFGTD